jgi:glutamate transport system substrate-binding protein
MGSRQIVRWALLAVLALVLAGLASGCGEDEESGQPEQQQAQQEVRRYPAESPLGRIQQKGEITVGVKFDVPPFGFKNPQTGDVEGFDVDMGRFVADALGVKPRYVEAVSDNRIPFLKEGSVDLILSTMTINAERDEEIDFSDPYYIARGRILVPRDSDIQGIDDLAGRPVCTALGSTYEATLKEQAPRARLRLVDTYSECLELIQNGAVEAVSTDDVILTGMIIQDDSLKLTEGEPLTTEPYGAGIRQGQDQVRTFVNDVFERVKQDGRWARTYQKWVGQYTDEPQQPPTMSLEEALRATS